MSKSILYSEIINQTLRNSF
ncbi:unnamed protein product [Larinioides sclopetarius]|uniref:Uncharacterized protein n=1 Tax=Larinioides sclopetarius TaxID=280406 RepID=A0AAV2BLA3_9ARAC